MMKNSMVYSMVNLVNLISYTSMTSQNIGEEIDARLFKSI